jgi:4-methylaminobutanoate oxidase (formaldehyde-forming)
VTGPNARALLSSVSPADFGNDAFPFRSACEIEIGYGRALALRVSYAGELGWELYIPCDLAAGVLEALQAAGTQHGLRLGGTAAMGSLRVEKGFRAWGHDVGPLTSPLEAGLGFAVALGKGDFLGREALLRQREAGVKRRLLSFTLDDSELFPHGNEPLFRDGQRCGSVSSATYGHSLGRAVTLGWIGAGSMDDAALSASGYEIEIADRRHPLTLYLRPPIDPAGKRLRA